MEVTIFFGPPCVGKGTNVDQLLLENPDLIPVPTGKILRNLLGLKDDMPEIKNHINFSKMREFLAKDEASYIKIMSQGKILPDIVSNTIVQLFIEKLNPNSHFIFDGYPRNLSQAQTFGSFLESKDANVRLILLDATLDTLLKRNEIRRITDSKPRPDDDPAIFKERIKEYERDSEPVTDFYRSQQKLYVVDANGDKHETYKLVKDILMPERPVRVPKLEYIPDSARAKELLA